ncbi:hypothetical protein WH87_03945 [Devosia epidermidihirudinis]|uniref:Uncharacterized protein n=1 Tax=Devosia epidermidihirudinis TaxID=1293439 RepID=A0A0F5QEI8_9HYPH|nr:hypothetical protein [Devosia epidermidihirudinis]KKC39375.1 hypothetical protein WH87_03945 [Devosia epidermidihirudinis]
MALQKRTVEVPQVAKQEVIVDDHDACCARKALRHDFRVVAIHDPGVCGYRSIMQGVEFGLVAGNPGALFFVAQAVQMHDWYAQFARYGVAQSGFAGIAGAIDHDAAAEIGQRRDVMHFQFRYVEWNRGGKG